MTYRSFSLMPLFSRDARLSERFTQMDNLFSKLTGEKPVSNIPEYNLVKYDQNKYSLTVSVPGFSQDELDVSVIDNQLLIHGKPNIKPFNKSKYEKKENITWINHGIQKNEFSLSFNLEHGINIQDAILDKGLLILNFNYIAPEREKIQKISITVKDREKKDNFSSVIRE